MSRIGILPVEIPDGVEVDIDDSMITVKGKNGELSFDIHPDIDVSIQDGEVVVDRSSDDKDARSLHGMVRSHIEGMVQGVQEQYEKKLEMHGVGYRVQQQGQKLVIEVGYSHPVEVEPRGHVEFEVEGNDTIIVRGPNKQLVGEMAAEIRSIREPEPYKGKGIRYEGEYIRRKEGKTG